MCNCLTAERFIYWYLLQGTIASSPVQLPTHRLPQTNVHGARFPYMLITIQDNSVKSQATDAYCPSGAILLNTMHQQQYQHWQQLCQNYVMAPANHATIVVRSVYCRFQESNHWNAMVTKKKLALSHQNSNFCVRKGCTYRCSPANQAKPKYQTQATIPSVVFSHNPNTIKF